MGFAVKPALKTALQQGILAGDGAMGTYLYQLGFPIGISYEELNLIKPEIIADVHRKYYHAGARIIETNSFSANREKLSKYGLEKKVKAINRQAVVIARNAVGKDAYILGSVGSIRAGKRKWIRPALVNQYFQEQMEALLEEGTDGLILESFYELEEMEQALSIARKLTDLPVICQFSVDEAGLTQDGFFVFDAFQRLVESGADIVGFNCRTGPNGIMRAMEKKPDDWKQTPLSVFPNAGIPDYVDGKYQYVSTPEYFADCAVRFADLGARIIGGCCGTTPEHVAAISRVLQNYRPKDALLSGAKVHLSPAAEVIEVSQGSRVGPESSILEKVRKRHTVIVELDPPKDLDIGKFMEGARALKKAKADALTMADNSLAVTRMSNLALGVLVREKIGLVPLVHIACRDRNLIGTQSHLMGLHALGIHHVLAVTGDPARFGDLPGSSSVYDLTSFDMIRMIKRLNEGLSFSGKPLKHKANFVVAAAFNPNVKYLGKAIERLERKIEAGADFIMTQPVYHHRLIERLYEETKHLNIPVFIGIMPLASGRNAEYLHNEVPGIQLSDEVLRRMRGLEGEEGRQEGIKIAKELLDTAMKYFQGIYLITPFMFYDMTVQLTNYVWEKTKCMNSFLSPMSK